MKKYIEVTTDRSRNNIIFVCYLLDKIYLQMKKYLKYQMKRNNMTFLLSAGFQNYVTVLKSNIALQGNQCFPQRLFLIY